MYKLSQNAHNSKTQTKAHQLYTAVVTPTYNVSLLVIPAYSAKLEPVCNTLQGLNTNIKSVYDYLAKFNKICESHRTNAVEEFKVIFHKASEICTKLEVELKVPRIVARQTLKSNHPHENVEEFFRRSIFISYLDSLISSIIAHATPPSQHEKAAQKVVCSSCRRHTQHVWGFSTKLG